MQLNEVTATLAASQNELAIANDQVRSLKAIQGEDSKRLQLSIEQMNDAVIQLPHLKAEVEAMKQMRRHVNEIEEAVREEVTHFIHKGSDGGTMKSGLKWAKLPQLKQVLPGLAAQLDNLLNAYSSTQMMLSERSEAIDKLRSEQGNCEKIKLELFKFNCIIERGIVTIQCANHIVCLCLKHQQRLSEHCYMKKFITYSAN